MAAPYITSKDYIVKHVLNGGAVVAQVSHGTVVLSPFVPGFGIGVWLITDEREAKFKKIDLYRSKLKSDAKHAAIIFKHLAIGEYQFYTQKVIDTDGERISEPKRSSKKQIPKTVERYFAEHKEQGVPDGKAWALAWSRFCKYSFPGSRRCHKKAGDYLTHRP